MGSDFFSMKEEHKPPKPPTPKRNQSQEEAEQLAKENAIAEKKWSDIPRSLNPTILKMVDGKFPNGGHGLAMSFPLLGSCWCDTALRTTENRFVFNGRMFAVLRDFVSKNFEGSLDHKACTATVVHQCKDSKVEICEGPGIVGKQTFFSGVRFFQITWIFHVICI